MKSGDHADRYDVLIAGGGLAGLCLAIELARKVPDCSVLLVEKREGPAPLAAHKVGESSVEVASHYFREVLGVGDLLSHELPKFGLRFLMSAGDNQDVSRRLECGPSHFLRVPSYQIDRGQFENGLAHRAIESGATLLAGWMVRGFDLGDGEVEHSVVIERAGVRREIRCRWLIDATGRSALLKKRIGLRRANRHDVNAAWFRIDHPIDLDQWSDDLGWRGRLKHPRRLSTNHLMGEGYWVWLIPLAGGRTSVGVVADAALHPFEGIASFEKVLSWMDRHEPQCASVIRDLLDHRMDFLALKNYSYDVRQMFSARRWCVVGEAGMFLDPLYSPGSDFIAIANGYATDLILRDRRGEPLEGVVRHHDLACRALGRTYLVNYHRQYPLMGSPRVMTTKIVWDFTMYWGGIALLYIADRLCDDAFTEQSRPIMQRFAALNIRMQAHFREWARAAEEEAPPPGAFVDYAELGFLSSLNAELLDIPDDASLLARLERNLTLAEDLKLEILAESAKSMPGLADSLAGAPTTEHLSDMFRVMRPEALPRP